MCGYIVSSIFVCIKILQKFRVLLFALNEINSAALARARRDTDIILKIVLINF